MIASWGKRLIDWLNSYTFPEEIRLNDPDYARAIAQRYLDLVLDHGTTSVASFCTSHPGSVDALFEAGAQRGMAVVAGKTCMDRNAPDALKDTAQSAYDVAKPCWSAGTARGAPSTPSRRAFRPHPHPSNSMPLAHSGRAA